jgi:hypothetical protein
MKAVLPNSNLPPSSVITRASSGWPHDLSPTCAHEFGTTEQHKKWGTTL